MAQMLKQSTTVTIRLGPFLDKTDGVTEKTAITPVVEVSKNHAAFGARNSATAITHDSNGWYAVELNATDTATLGPLVVKADDAATYLPVWREFTVVEANVYDSLVGGSDKLKVRDQTMIRTATAQAGAANSITLDAAASAQNQFYNNTWIAIIAGTGVGQARLVRDYVASTKVAGITPDWATTPDVTSVFVVLPAAYINVGGLASEVLTASATAATFTSLIETTIWDAMRSNHGTAGSFGQGAASVQGNVTGSINSLATQAKADVNAEVDGALNTAIPGSPTADSVNERVKTLDDAYTATRGGYLDKLNITGNVASSAEVTAIQNNTRVRVIIPPLIERPDSGSTAYKLHLYIYDEVGNMEAPDSTPTLTVVNEAGTDRSANLGTVTAAGTGHYTVTYTVSSSHAIEELLFEWSIVEGGVTRLHGAAAQIVDTTAVDFTSADRTKLDTLHDTRLTATRAGNLDNLDAAVSTRSSHTAAQAGTDAASKVLVTPANKLATDGSGQVTVADIIAAALAKFFTTNSGSTYAAAVAGSVVKEIADHAAGGGGGETQLRAGTAQGGGASTITLDAGASAVNDCYKYAICALTGGTGAGQCEIVASYAGSSKIATMGQGWATPPDATTHFVLLPLGAIPGATAPTASANAEAVLDALSTQKLLTDRATGRLTAYRADGVTPRGTRELTEIGPDQVALVPV